MRYFTLVAALMASGCGARSSGPPPAVASTRTVPASTPTQPLPKAVAQAPAVPVVKSPRTGEVGWLRAEDEPEIWVAVTEAANDRLTRLSTARDSGGIQQLIDSGLVLMVGKDTKVKLISPGLAVSEIRILEGPHAGKSGFVSAEWVSLTPP